MNRKSEDLLNLIINPVTTVRELTEEAIDCADSHQYAEITVPVCRPAVIRSAPLPQGSAAALFAVVTAIVVTGAWLPAPVAALEITIRSSEPGAYGSGAAVGETVTRVETPGDDNVGSAADIASRSAGVRVDASGGEGGWSTLSIRGGTASQTSVELEDMPLSGAGSDTFNLNYLDAALLKSVEIIRDPSGSLAPIGGTVRLRFSDNNPRPYLMVGCGSYASCRGAFRVSPVTGPTTLTLGLAAFDSRNNYLYPSDNGTPLRGDDDRIIEARNNAVHRLNLLASGRGTVGGGQVRLLALGLYHRMGLMGRDLDEASQAAQTTRSFSLLQSWKRPLSSGLQARQHYWLRLSDIHFEDRFSELGAGVPDIRTNLWENGGRLTMAGEWLATGLSTQLALTGRLERSQGEDVRDGSRSPVSIRNSISLEASGAWRWWRRRGVVQLGVLYQLARSALNEHPTDYVSVAAPRQEHSRIVSPRVGVRVRLRPWLSLHSQLAQGTRLPSFVELFGNQGFLMPNPLLLPERSDNWSGGADFESLATHEIRAALNVFIRRTRDQITFVQNSPNTSRAENLQEVQARGIEIEQQVRLRLPAASLLFWQGMGNLLLAEDRGDEVAYYGIQIPRTPQWSLWQKISLERSFNGWLTAIFWQLDLRAETYRDRAGRGLIPALEKHTAGVSVRPRGLSLPATVALRVENLLDRTNYSYDRHPLAGRSYFLSLIIQPTDTKEYP